ncbi:MAG TPA: helix-turn-helix domain-containing protein [Candidatus Binataceae bacterium]|jgi:excisionase family DNA binding protein|nr:helix-turn-helix domain-containing protein [Candidatus Binataceae bacterium]
MKKKTTKRRPAKRPSRVAEVEPKDEAPSGMPSDMASEIMTLREVADYLACHPVTIYRLAQSREIPAFRLGGNWRFKRSEIGQWITQRQKRPKRSRDEET